MESKQCSEPGCIHEVEYACQCTSPETYSCEMHFGKHLKLPNNPHTFSSIFIEPCGETKAAIFAFLTKEKSKHIKLKSKILASFSQRLINSENDLRELLRNLDSSSEEINNYLSKLSQTKKLLKSEQDPFLRLLSLQPDEAIKNIKIIIPDNPDWYSNIKLFCGFNEKIEKMLECFIKDKFEAYQDKRFKKIESTLKKHNEAISITNNELANVKDDILAIINENKKRKLEFELWKEKLKIKTEKDTNIFNSQAMSITQDLNLKVEKDANLLNSQIISAIQYFSPKTKETKSTERKNDINITLQNLKDKTSEILNRPNCPELEMDFRKTCSLYKTSLNPYDLPLTQAYQDYINTYHLKTSIYNIIHEIGNKSNLLIYNTEIESKETKIFDTPEPLDCTTCIAQLPNGNLFCYGKYPTSGITLIVDRNGLVQELTSGTPCGSSSAIYFRKSIYCFGGNNGDWLNLSDRFDLDENRWNKLTPMPKPDCCCNSVIFNGHILISGRINRNILRYSIDNNSFALIPYEFAYSKIKIMINVERLFLIECENGSIYESEIANDSAWKQIAKSTISANPWQVYCLYNKGAVYIGSERGKYHKFILKKKRLVALK